MYRACIANLSCIYVYRRYTKHEISYIHDHKFKLLIVHINEKFSNLLLVTCQYQHIDHNYVFYYIDPYRFEPVPTKDYLLVY